MLLSELITKLVDLHEGHGESFVGLDIGDSITFKIDYSVDTYDGIPTIILHEGESLVN